MYRPAGMSDDDDDDDDEDDYFGGRRNRGLSDFKPTNGAPKTIEEAIIRKDIGAAEKFLAIALSKGHSIDGCLSSGLPALIMACSYGFLEGIELLLRKGANPNVEKELITPLSMCCSTGVLHDDIREACVDRLLLSGANPNTIDSRGRVPLMLAASYGFRQVVARFLMSPETSLSLTDPRGWTALFFAMEAGHADIAEQLIEAGLDPGIKDKDGCTAEELFYIEKPLAGVKVAELFLEPFVQEVDCSLSVEKLEEPSERCLNEFLAQLPGPDGEGGFSGTVREILNGSGCLNLNLPDADLYSVLSGSDEELKRLGVKLAPLRRKILRSIHRYHLRPWSQNSLYHPSKDTHLGIDDIVNMIATILRHLVIIRSGLAYLSGRLQRSHGDHSDVSARQEQTKILVDIYRAQKQLQRRLLALLAHHDKIKDIGENRPGYVGPVAPSCSRFFQFKAVTAFATILIAAFVFVRSR